VCVPPTDIPATGRFTVIGDPSGAFLSLYKGNKESPGYDPDEPVPGRICWNELLSKEPEKAQQFFTDLCGWKPQPKDMGPMGVYRVQMHGDKQAGGIMKNPQNGAPDAWLCYFFVLDLAAATQKAKALGAMALMENTPIPEVGAFSMLMDPLGAPFALLQVNAIAGSQ
jgi:uncharacterized protein